MEGRETDEGGGLMSKGKDDGIDWSNHWTAENPPDREDFTDPSVFDYANEYLPKPPFSVLELGSGPGFWSGCWRALGATYSGVDANPDAVRIGRMKHPTQTYYLMPAEDIEFVGMFDVVFTHTFLQHTNEGTKRQIVPRVHRVLKKEGIFLVQENTANGNTPTTYDKDGWVRLIEPYGFTCLLAQDERFVFRRV
jgi:SAM-dependent methyltransferase